MNKELKMSYETMGSSSYMTVTCPPGLKLVNYEMEMMLSNEIKNLLTVSRQMLNEETVIYYNITSRIPLKQVLDKRKLNRRELFRLIEGAILAVRDAAAFRLPEAGIVLEPEYIYVNPATCAPEFMFMPIQERVGVGIREFLSDLVLRDRIEMSNDNFIQVLLAELNRQPFSAEGLEKSLKQFQIQEHYGAKAQDQSPAMWTQDSMPPVNIQSGSISPANMQPVNMRPANMQPVNLQPANVSQIDLKPMSIEESVTNRREDKPKVPDFSKTKEKEKKQKTNKKKLQSESVKENGCEKDLDSFDSEQAKKKFLLPQALVMVVTAACVSFGVFTNKSGGIVINNILAFLIVVGLGEVILYREIYVNSKSPQKEKNKKSVDGKKKSPKPSTERPEVPRQVSPMPTLRQQIPEQQILQQMSQAHVDKPPAFLQPVNSQPMQPQPMPVQVAYGQPSMPQYAPYGGAEDTDIESETELLGGDVENDRPAYLEYYENGNLSRIPIAAPGGIVIGRLKQQVDFEVKSPRVGKVHAKFFSQEGRCYVVDINSKNGTFVNGNGMRIESNAPYLLHDKDRIMLADSEFTVRCSES